MRYPPTAFCLVSAVFFVAVASASADELVLPTSAKIVQEAGGRVLGEFPETGIEKGLLLGEKLAFAMPAARYFNPARGSIELKVRPAWNGNDGAAHTFFHLGGGDMHVTVFKTDAGSLRFVYKASPAHYAACDIDVSGWKSGQRHSIGANWLQVGDQNLLLQLRVDEQTTLRSGATILPEIPKELFLGRRGAVVQPAEARFLHLRLSEEPGLWPYPTKPKTPVTATVDLADMRPTRKVHDFTTIWNNRENPLPFEVGDPEYERFLDARFRMVRLVAFSESWLWGTDVSVSADGRLVTDFTDFDRLLDVFSSAGVEPYIRLAYHTPHALVDPSLSIKEQRYALPTDLEMWDELMERIVRHVRFDRNLPVRYWVTALNEADLAVRRNLAKADTTYQLYERTSRLVKALDPEARVGGPALAWSVEADGTPAKMLVDFVRFCRERNVPLDFVCFHGYSKAHPRDYERLLQTIRSTVEKEWPEKKGKLEYILDEWNLWNRDRRQDNEYGASYLAGALQYQRRSGLTKSSIVSFNHFLPTHGDAKTLVEKTGPFKRDEKSPVCFEPGLWKCGPKERQGFRLHPPSGNKEYSFARFVVDVPRGNDPTLKCATGVAGTFERWNGCGFSLVVRCDGRSEKLFDHVQRTRPWQEHDFSLASYAGRTVEIEFRTTPGPKGNASGDWAVWAEPRLVARESPIGKEMVKLNLLDQAERTVAGARRDEWRFVYNDDTIARYVGLPLIKGPVVTTPYFVWLMHSRLAEHEAGVELPGQDGILGDDSGGLTATVEPGRVALLLWQFDLLRDEPRQWKITVNHLPEQLKSAGQLQMTEYRIDREHNNPYTEYVIRGADNRNGQYNLETAHLEPLRTEVVPVTGDGITIDVSMPNQSVSLFELSVEQ